LNGVHGIYAKAAVGAKVNPVEFSQPKELFELAAATLNGRYYDVGPDGRFLTNSSPYTARAQGVGGQLAGKAEEMTPAAGTRAV
jgi:hypothetical protein